MAHKSDLTEMERKRRDGAILFGHLNGDSTNALAERNGLSIMRINQILRSQGVNKRKGEMERTRRVLELDQDGKSREEISEETGLKRDAIKATLRRNGYYWIPKKLRCAICDEYFLQKVHNQIHCSDECRCEYNRRQAVRNQKEDIGIWKKCEFCGKQYKAYAPMKYKQRFCNRSCSNLYRYKNNELRNKEILYLRDEQNLTFVDIGRIFKIEPNTARHAYRKQRLIVNLERAEMGLSSI